MNSIRTYVVECLESYSQVAREIELLQCELSSLATVTEKEMLDVMAFAKEDSDVRRSKRYVSDRTANIAMYYRDLAVKINDDTRLGVMSQLRPLKAKKERLDRCIMFLSLISNRVLTGLYIHGRAVKDLALELHISERTVLRYRDNAVEELVSMYNILEQVGIVLE